MKKKLKPSSPSLGRPSERIRESWQYFHTNLQPVFEKEMDSMKKSKKIKPTMKHIIVATDKKTGKQRQFIFYGDWYNEPSKLLVEEVFRPMTEDEFKYSSKMIYPVSKKSPKGISWFLVAKKKSGKKTELIGIMK